MSPTVNAYVWRPDESLKILEFKTMTDEWLDFIVACRRGEPHPYDLVAKIYELADVYHSDNIDRVCDDFIEETGLQNGTFDAVGAAKYAVPSHWDMGKIYKRLILGVAKAEKTSIVDALFAVYRSYVAEKLDDYNSSFYYDAPDNILNAYLYGDVE